MLSVWPIIIITQSTRLDLCMILIATSLNSKVPIIEEKNDDSEVDEDEIFPLQTVEDLESFETRLKTDIQFRKSLVRPFLILFIQFWITSHLIDMKTI